MLPLSNVKTRYLLFLVSICAVFAAKAYSQVNFIQFTDLHLYDDKKEKEKIDNRESNIEAFKIAVQQINRLAGPDKQYNFAIITGDLGIEALLQENLLSAPVKFDRKEAARRLDEPAKRFALIIKLSAIKNWVFVAGNNDLLDENPETIDYFDYFIEKLAVWLPDKRIINLTPREGPNEISSGGVTFIGFNNASFKNQNQIERVGCNGETPEHRKQFEEVSNIEKKINESRAKAVYLFYHIPEIGDRYLVEAIKPGASDVVKIKEGARDCIGTESIRSAWFVKSDIRDKWSEIVKSSKVKGLFAGHFHDYRPETYLDLKWLDSIQYSASSLLKLYVCPPLALKLQNGEPETARGFQEVSIDKEGNIQEHGIQTF